MVGSSVCGVTSRQKLYQEIGDDVDSTKLRDMGMNGRDRVGQCLKPAKGAGSKSGVQLKSGGRQVSGDGRGRVC